MSINKALKSFWNWLKAKIVADVSDRIDIDGDKPEMGDGGVFDTEEEQTKIDSDGVSFADLHWIYGGFDGSQASPVDGVEIAFASVLAQKDAEIAGLKAEKYFDNAALTQADRLLKNYLKPYGEAIAAGQAREAALRAEFDGFKTESALRLELVQKDVSLAKQEAQCCCQQNSNAIAQLAATLAGITKCVVPASAVCPAPMPLHNSWAAPTTTETA